MAVIKAFSRDKGGTAAIEYACIAALISIVIVSALRSMGANLSTLFFQPISTNLT